MGKTQAEYQKDYRARKKLTPNTNAPETNAPNTNAPVRSLDGYAHSDRGRIEAQLLGPLDVYSKARWARLEAKGYKWSPEWGWAVGVNDVEGIPMAVPVPGDPAYQAVSA